MCNIIYFTVDFIEISISILAFTISIASFFYVRKNNKKIFHKTVLKEIMDECLQEKMGMYKKHLYDFYRKNPKTYVDRYVNLVKKETKETDSIHMMRRYFSIFYQKVAFYYYKGFIDRKTLRSMWEGVSLDIIDEIILPIEFNYDKFIPEDDKLRISKVTYLMLDLYNELSNKNYTPQKYNPKLTHQQQKHIFHIALSLSKVSF
ncbi:hypothetical protein LJB98_04745 [Bacteroidales bacterium OttesenSCG-928-M11]|nr:hypothetical protein [Bacteroidales bacterium OttesenSCG-928-M11]